MRKNIMIKLKGFTLMEIVVVIAIIGLMALFVSPSYLDYQRNSRLSEAAQGLETAFGEAFSLSRSQPINYCIKLGLEAGNQYQVLKGENCEEEENIVAFPNGISLVLPESTVTVKFSPPFGDISISSGDNSKLEIVLQNIIGTTKTITVYTESGLVETGPLTRGGIQKIAP